MSGNNVPAAAGAPATGSAPLLKVQNLVKRFPIQGGLLSRTVGHVHAVDGVSFELPAGETLGVVGESGCGKSTTGRCILRLIEPTSGEVWFEGKSVTHADKDQLRALARDMQIIFQDPFASLNPRMTVSAIIGEALTIHKLAPTREAYEARIVDLLAGLAPRGAGDRLLQALHRRLELGDLLLVLVDQHADGAQQDQHQAEDHGHEAAARLLRDLPVGREFAHRRRRRTHRRGRHRSPRRGVAG